MAGGCKHYIDITQCGRFIPIHFGNFGIYNAPTLQMRFDAQRHIKMSGFIF